MKILSEISVGELLDKITILEIKRDKISDSKKLEIIDKEYMSLNNSLKQNLTINDEIKKLWEKLKEINVVLWNIEDSKRLAEKNKKFDEKFIKLSRDVYKSNDKRAEIKLKINEILGSNIKEVKSY